MLCSLRVSLTGWDWTFLIYLDISIVLTYHSTYYSTKSTEYDLRAQVKVLRDLPQVQSVAWGWVWLWEIDGSCRTRKCFSVLSSHKSSVSIAVVWWNKWFFNFRSDIIKKYLTAITNLTNLFDDKFQSEKYKRTQQGNLPPPDLALTFLLRSLENLFAWDSSSTIRLPLLFILNKCFVLKSKLEV